MTDNMTNDTGDGQPTSRDRNIVALILDVFVFAPLGLLAESHALFPKLAETGRHEVENRIKTARVIGQFAVQRGRRRAATAVDNIRAANATSPNLASPADTPAPAVLDDDEEVVIPVRGVSDDDDSGIREPDLAIPSYDSLAASQVVPRLEGLTPFELESVRRYELAHRGRKTVLGKITNLQSPPQ
jgi:hypothetical protein